MNRGPNHHKAKLTDEQIRLIRLDPAPAPVMAKIVGVCPSYIRKIRRGFARKVIADVNPTMLS